MAEADTDNRNDHESTTQNGGDNDYVELGKRYRVFYNQPLVALDRGPAKAFRAQNFQGSNLVAYLCTKEYVPRMRYLNSYGQLFHPNLIRLEGYGVVHWVPDDRERFLILYDSNLAAPLVPAQENPNGVAMGIKGDLAAEKIVKPLIDGLTDIRNIDFVHGSINPFNIYTGKVGSYDDIILGDALAVPPSYMNPSICETIERSMADPVARGLGTHLDDMYSFGVTLACLMRQQDAFQGLTDREIIHAKIEHGTYNAMLGKERIQGSVWELLRGLLQDAPSQRWTFDDVLVWADGRRLSPKQNVKGVRASRPIDFAGKRHSHPQSLALYFMSAKAEAQQILETDNLQRWLERSISDDHYTDIVDRAVKSALETGPQVTFGDRLYSRVIVGLFPTAPMCSNGVVFHPDGIGYSLYRACYNGEDLEPYKAIFMQNLATYWSNMQFDLAADTVAVITEHETCRRFLQDKSLGSGIERCVYYTCSGAPCLSDIFRNYFVLHTDAMLKAYDKIGRSKKSRPVEFIDKHVAAFLMARDRRVIEHNISYLSSTEHHNRVLGVLRTIGEMQRTSGLQDLTGLSDWLCDYVSPLVKRIHSRETRAKVNEYLVALRKKGDIAAIVDLFDNDKRVALDRLNYAHARQEFRNVSKEEVDLERFLKSRHNYGRSAGREASVVVSVLIAGLVVFAFLFISFAKQGEAVFG